MLHEFRLGVLIDEQPYEWGDNGASNYELDLQFLSKHTTNLLVKYPTYIQQHTSKCHAPGPPVEVKHIREANKYAYCLTNIALDSLVHPIEMDELLRQDIERTLLVRNSSFLLSPSS